MKAKAAWQIGQRTEQEQLPFCFGVLHEVPWSMRPSSQGDRMLTFIKNIQFYHHMDVKSSEDKKGNLFLI